MDHILELYFGRTIFQGGCFSFNSTNNCKELYFKFFIRVQVLFPHCWNCLRNRILIMVWRLIDKMHNMIPWRIFPWTWVLLQYIKVWVLISQYTADPVYFMCFTQCQFHRCFFLSQYRFFFLFSLQSAVARLLDAGVADHPQEFHWAEFFSLYMT